MNARPPLNADALRADLPLPWRRLDVVTETGSTNADLLARAAAGGDIAGAVLLTDYQSAGRGRHGRVWSAPPRSQVVVSFGVDADGVPVDRWGWLPLATGLAIVDAVDEVTGVRVGLKWPNDVVVDEAGNLRKLAGILAEVASPAPVIVSGLGLNVTLTAEEAPDPRAVSLAQLHAADLDRSTLAHALIRHVGVRVDSWRSGDPAERDRLATDYRSCSVTIGSRVRAILPGDNTLVGTAVDIDELGRLIIDTGAESVTVSAGDITHLRPAGS